jgi:hypothetical protein
MAWRLMNLRMGIILHGACGSAVVKALCCKQEKSRIRDPMKSMTFLNLPNPSSRNMPWDLLSL